MATLKLYGELPQSIELSDGTSMNLVFSSFQQSNTAKEPFVQFDHWGEGRVNYKQLCDYYRSFVPEKIFFSIPDKYGDIRISEKDYLKMKSKFDKYQEKQRALELCAELNNKGIELEKAGEIDKAIEVYELNIAGKCYPARHAFNRLLVLYRKNKNYKAEKKVCQKALKLFGKIESEAKKYSERLDKIDKLLGKVS